MKESQEENWKQIQGFDYYDVSDLGRVRSWIKQGSSKSNRRIEPYILWQRRNRDGRLYILLRKNMVQKSYSIHRLVLMTFTGRILGKDQVNHIDGDPTNNKLENLEWCTGKENMDHAIKIGLFNSAGENNPQAKLDDQKVREILRLYGEGQSKLELANKYNVTKSNIYYIVTGKTWKHIKR